ncbi:DUF1192 domain-containing protein [Polycladidibacter hongkongensis]|uniref:DUF1192 domain-containing protein n=1 Tax=Polycladidibacter hongkongensis TaxID=1647556 RepID=UPI00082C58F6|nr:DUF1192 domain-containing protein [Pseudovibrio hongkongensis]
MSVFDETPKPTGNQAMLSPDLSSFSLAELQERLERLKAEITRTESEIRSKETSTEAAESLFKSK